MMVQAMSGRPLIGVAIITLMAASCDATPEVAGENQPAPSRGTGAELVFNDFETIDPSWNAGKFENGVTAIYDAEFDDAIIDVDVRLAEGTADNWQTVECRIDGNYYYDLGISADGYYIIDVWIDGVQHEKSLGPTPSPYIVTGAAAVNSLHVECIGNRLSLSVNGNLLAELEDNAILSGGVGLSVNALAETFSEAAFDNFRVAAP
jgi:hypothetical protein